jgi:uncharacterized protein involved in exopolysaccharide biosynthesis
MEKNSNNSAMVTVAHTAMVDPKGQRPPGAPPPAPAGGGLPNPVVLIRRAMAHWPVAAVVMVIGALATVQVIRMRKPIYRSETVVFYRQGVLAGDATPSDQMLRTLGTKLKETLLAQSNLKKIIDENHLYTDIVDKRGYSDAVDQFRKQIDFKARSTDTFAISFQGSSREEAQTVTSRLADMLVEENSRSRQERAKESTDFLDAQKKRADEKLDGLETELAQFMATHPEFVTDSGGRAGAAIRAAEKKNGIVASGGDRPTIRRRFTGGPLPIGGRAIPDMPAAAGGPAAPPVDPVLLAQRASLMAELIAANKDLNEKSVRFTDQHPDVRAAKARVASAEAKLQEAEAAIQAAQPPPPPPPVKLPEDPYADPSKATPPKDVPVAKADPTDSPKDKPAEKPPTPPGKDSQIVNLETEWNRLNREVGKAREEQKQLEGRLFQAEITASSEIGGYAATIAILDPAFRPAAPSGAPNRTILIGGFVASLLVGIILAAARGILLDDRLFDASEIDNIGLAPVLAVVPKVKPAANASPRGARA